MNTREKIVSAIRGEESMVVIGTFDPLLRVHAQRVQELRVPGRPLIVLVADPPGGALLPLQARLELVAALEAVDFVAAYNDGFPMQRRHQIQDDRELHERWSHEFREHVRRRNQDA
jgi:bifunctional ADP-heptose synthase (sugar kinase/adenylyltransferase)